MDTFITIISWVGGIALFFLLGLSLVFSSAANAQTGKSGFGIIAVTSGVLMVWLLWMGGASLYHAAGSATDAIVNASHKETAKKQSEQTDKANIASKNGDREDIRLQILFILVCIPFLIWLFTPSAKEDKEKDRVRKKFVASMSFNKDGKFDHPERQ